MTFAAVISDLDGVLVDSDRRRRAARGRRGARATASTAPRSRPPTTGGPAREVIAEHVRPAAGRRRDRLPRATAEIADTDGVVALPGAADVLALRPGGRDRHLVHRAARPRPAAPPPGCPSRRPRHLATRSRAASRRPTPTCWRRSASASIPAQCLVLEDAPRRHRRRRARPGMTVWAVTTTHDARRARRGAAGGRRAARAPRCPPPRPVACAPSNRGGSGTVKLVIGIVRPEKANDVLEALYRAEVRGVSLSRVQGHGGELDRVETYRGTRVQMGLVGEGPLRDRGLRPVRRSRRSTRCARARRPARSATARSSSCRWSGWCASAPRDRRRRRHARCGK